MDKEEAMKILKDFHDKSALFSVRTALETLHPELKKSEGERIKNLIYCLIRDRNDNGKLLEQNGVMVEEALAWLEKQDKFIENNEDDSDTDFIIYHPLKNGKGRYECIPYSFYGMLSSFSEDKDMIDFLRLCFYTEEECNEWIKQNESTDKVESKFHEGDWIVWQNKCYKVNYNGCGYELIDQNGLSTSLEYGTVDTYAHLWDITKDAKDGDVLVASDSSIFIFKEVRGSSCKHYIALTSDNEIQVNTKLDKFWETARGVKPSTKEQRDTLLKAMADAGYTFDFGKKELKKIEKKSQRMVSAEAKEALYDKPDAWSEKDEAGLSNALWAIKQAKTIAKDENDMGNLWYAENWLNSIKNRIQQKQEWGEEDKQYFNFLEKLLENLQVKSTENEIKKGTTNNSEYYYKTIQWLKSLKERIKL